MSGELIDVASPVARKYLRLQRAPNVGPVCTRKLIAHFGSIDAVFEASTQELERVSDVGRHRAESIRRARENESLDDELAHTAELGCRIICLEDKNYPQSLRHIPDPPVCIGYRGTIEETDGLAVAVVGSRRCTRYAVEQAERFGALLGQAGITVVSGMARGADAAAHRGALQAGGRTLAVQGCGLAHIYPPEHADLAERITSSGALISELPLTTAPDAANFPPRNRIIVGLSLGVLVVEAGLKSGALISARLGNEYNREVFAIPGLINNPTAQGTNALIRDGAAKLVTCLDDLLDELGEAGNLLRQTTTSTASTIADSTLLPIRLDPSEQAVLDAIEDEDTSLEHICQRSGLSAAAVAAGLTRLQMKGAVVQRPGNYFSRRRPVGL